MHTTGNHHLTTSQRLILAAIIVSLVALPGTLLYAALSAHGPAPAVPGPAPVTVQPAPVSATDAPPLSV